MKVLVVEDSSFARMAVTKVVGALLPQAEFFEAADGKTGLALFQTMRFWRCAEPRSKRMSGSRGFLV